MPEKQPDRTIYSLAELAAGIQRTLAERFSGYYWVKAELNKLNRYPHSGHCYPELVEKADGKIIAELKATIWKEDFERINANFMRVLHEPVRNGIKVLLSARVQYHPVYGLALRIIDIDPSWTLGELEMEKQATIRILKQEGIFDANRSLTLPLLVKRLAVISVETSKGYADFRAKIDEKEWGYRLFHMLFPALLQGDQAVDEIILQLERIRRVRHHFDAVAIIRGGGGDVGLTCYNHVSLARAVARYPLPVLTGIGHSTNETVVEMVACRNAITPTELADLLIRKFTDFGRTVMEGTRQIADRTRIFLRQEKRNLSDEVRYLRTVTSGRLKAEMSEMKRFPENILRHVSNASGLRHQQLDALENSISLLDPVNVMKRGYSITLAGDQVVRSPEQVKPGDRLKTLLPGGEIASITESVKKD